MRERDRGNNFFVDFEDYGLNDGYGYEDLINIISGAPANNSYEAQRQAEIAAQQEAARRQEELRAQNAARLAAEQEAARQAQIAAEEQRRIAVENAWYEQQARAQAEAQRQAELQAYEDQQRVYRENQARQERAQAEAQARAQQEAQARAQAEAQARAQQEAARRQEELRAQNAARLAAEQEAARQAQERAQAEAQQEAQRQAEIAAEAQRRKAEEDAFLEQQARAQAEQQAEQQRQAQAQAEQQAEQQRQAQAQAEAQARAQAEQQAETQARAQAEQQAEAQRVEQKSYENIFEDRPTVGLSAMERRDELANMLAEQNKPAEPANAATIEALIKQIQARSDTSQWSGGYGADQATKDMARILAETGITDISQFGPITREVQKVVGYEDWGDPIYQTVTEQTFGNKETGQAVPNTYTERQTGNFFGGTYEGKGNTGYGVQFDDQGLPVFYTQGASSSDMGSIAPFLTLASFVPGLQPFAMAANAAIAAKQDNPLGVITNLAGMGNLAGVSGMADVAKAARFASAVKSGDPLAMAFSGANLGGVTNIGGVDLKDISKTIGAVKAIESGDPLTMMLYGIDVMSKPGSATPTSSAQKDFFDSEKARLTSAGYTSDQIKDYFRNLENLTEDLDFQPEIPPIDSTLLSPTRSLSGDTQVDEADDFLKSIGIKTIDRPSDSGLSNQDILNLINADNEVLVTSNRDTVGKGMSEDIFRNLEDAGELPSLTPAEKLPELVVTGDRDTVGKGVSEDIFRNLEDAGEPLLPLPVADSNRVEIVGNRPPAYLPTDDDFPATPIPTPTTPGAAPAPKVPTPIKAPTAPAPAASSGMDMMGLLALLGGQQQPMQQAPMQDPYAHIKLMEDLFGSTIDLTPAGENTAQRK